MQYQNDMRLSNLEFIWLEITRKCNLRCIHCYASSAPQVSLMGRLGFSDWRHVLKEAASLGCKKVQFIGGEPLLYPHLIDLIADARHLNYEFVEVFTNGTLLNEYLLESFKKFNVQLAFSVYSYSAEIHDSVTQRSGSFNKTLNGIQGALEYGLKIRVGMIVMDINKSQIEDLKTMFARMGIETFNIDKVRGVGRGEQLIQSKAGFSELCGACWRGKLCVDPDGYVFPCVFSRFYVLGNISEGLEQILNSERLHSFRLRVLKQSKYLIDCVPEWCSPDTCIPSTEYCYPDLICTPDLEQDATSHFPSYPQ